MDSRPAVLLHDLSKRFGDRLAVDGIDLTVPTGQVFGLLGPNGAGKTTVIKMMLGLVRPTSGTVELFGSPASHPAARARVGFLPEQFRFHDWLTATEFLDFHGRLYGLDARQRSARVTVALDRVGLAHRATSPLRTFSKGMLQRIGLAQALLNDPLLLVLDEPTSGLDPVGRREVRDLVVELRQQGVTILLNSHILSEIERVCDQVAILDLGKVVWQGSPRSWAEQPSDGLLGPSGGFVAADTVATERVGAVVGNLMPEAIAAARLLAPDLAVTGDRLEFTPKNPEHVADVVAALVSHGVRLYALQPVSSSLEDLFVRLVEGRDA